MGQLTQDQFKTFHKEFQEIEPVINSVKRHLRDQGRTSLTNKNKLTGLSVSSDDDYDFFHELYRRGYKLVKV